MTQNWRYSFEVDGAERKDFEAFGFVPLEFYISKIGSRPNVLHCHVDPGLDVIRPKI